MNEEFRKLRAEVVEATGLADFLKTRLVLAERDCRHEWTKPVYDPIYEKGYTIPGDPPGVGGSDHQFPCEVPPKTIERWKRTCLKCGKVEFTNRSKPSGDVVPVF